jgi:sec-independent protein translocase protein TatC
MSEVSPIETDQGMPLLAHLKELRNRLFFALIVFIVGVLICFMVASDLVNFLTAPMRHVLGDLDAASKVDQVYLWLSDPIHRLLTAASFSTEHIQGELVITSSPLEGVYTYLMVAVVGGLILSSPAIAYQIWQFVAPGLYKTEQRVVFPLAVSSSFMFILGATFVYAVIFPVAFPFFLSVIDAAPMLSIAGLLKTEMRMMIAFGICFQLPVGTWFLANLGLIDHTDMLKGFRYAVVVIFFLAALITPPDVLTQLLLGFPLIGLYVVGIFVAYLSSTKERETEAP